MIPQKPSRDVREPATLVVLGIVAKKPALLRADAPTLVMPIESSVARVSLRGEEVVLDRSSCWMLPAGSRATVRPSASVVRVATLAFHEPLVARVARTYKQLGLTRDRVDKWLTRDELLPRTVWVHELVHRYVFERHALGERDNPATRFLETEILKEVCFLCRDREEGAERSTLQHQHSPPVARAVAHLEAHLFDVCSMAALARHAGASESTLLRAFRRELGCTPGAYWRRRKLDEALSLLRSGSHSVAEIANQVGYDNPTAFGHAFRLRFGHPPSWFRSRSARRPAP